MQNNLEKIVTVILFGSLWGFLEATVGGLMHFAGWPLTGQVMTSIGAFVMFWGIKSGLGMAGIASISLIAASFKFIDAFLFPIPINHITIINPAQAILMNGVAFLLFARLNRWTFSVSYVIMSMVLFNLGSYFIIGYKVTSHIENISRTVFLDIPAGVIMTVLASWLAERVKRYFDVSVFVKAMAALGLAVFAVLIKTIIA